jgi:hypothetical protein
MLTCWRAYWSGTIYWIINLNKKLIWKENLFLLIDKLISNFIMPTFITTSFIFSNYFFSCASMNMRAIYKLIVKTTYNLIGRIISKLVSMEMEIFIFVGYCLTLFDLQSQHRSLKLPFYMFYFIQVWICMYMHVDLVICQSYIQHVNKHG